MAAPVPFRTQAASDRTTPSFPPIVYYRDTYGFDDSRGKRGSQASQTTVNSDDSCATKSTVRTTLNVHPSGQIGSGGMPQHMYDSTFSRATNMTQSYHVEQLVTDRVITSNPRTLLTLTLVAFASAIQLLMFAVICVFYDGCPFLVGVVVSFLLILNTAVTFTFLVYRPTRRMLIVSCIFASISFVQSIGLFFWTAYLINHEEDNYIVSVGARENRIVTSTRIAMYSLQMVFAPIHAIAAAWLVYVLYGNLNSLNSNAVTRGYFFTEPQIGHQKILVPIEVRQVRELEDDSPDNASVGVQTSGTRTQAV